MTISTALARRGVMAATVGAAAVAAAAMAKAQTEPAAPSPELLKLKSLLDSYHEAFSDHDVAGVLKCFAPDAVVIGTGLGEIWGGPEEIGDAHRHFFERFDKGGQSAERLFADGNVVGDMGWVLAMTKMTLTKEGKTSEFGLNSSVVFQRQAGAGWLIRGMHISSTTTPA